MRRHLILAIALVVAIAASAQGQPPAPDRTRLSGAPTIEVTAYSFEGNTVFSDAELALVAAPWVRAGITTEDLLEVRNAVTRLYIERGYINSGATVPDQSPANNVVELRITEGRLTNVQVPGTRWFRSSYFTSRLRRVDQPLNVFDLEEKLQMLQLAHPGRRLDATLRPGTAPGESDLTVTVADPVPMKARIEYSNYQAPSIGGQRAEVAFAYESLTKRGDTASVVFGKTSGLEDLQLTYDLPLTAGDTTLRVQYRSGDSVVIEEPFHAVDIASLATTLSFGINHPLRKTPTSEWAVGASFDLRESETWLLGRPFTFSEGAVDGQSNVSALRARHAWTARSRAQVIATQMQFSWGLNILGASNSTTPIQLPSGGTRMPPTGRFFSWLGQVQWARRLAALRGTETVVRVDSQLGSDPLLAIEQFAIGGHASVRGYRENQMVRDSGAVASVEARFPLLVEASGRPTLRVGPFADVGTGWNNDRPTPDPRTLASVGVAAQLNLFRSRLVLQGAWAHALRDAGTSGDLQDKGVHFSVSVVPW